MKRKIFWSLLFSASLTMSSLSPTSSFGADRSNMQDILNKKAAIFSGIHKKASRNLVNAAQDKAFTKYFETTSESEKKESKERNRTDKPHRAKEV